MSTSREIGRSIRYQYSSNPQREHVKSWNRHASKGRKGSWKDDPSRIWRRSDLTSTHPAHAKQMTLLPITTEVTTQPRMKRCEENQGMELESGVVHSLCEWFAHTIPILRHRSASQRKVAPPIAMSCSERGKVALLKMRSVGNTSSNTNRATSRPAIPHDWLCVHVRLVVRNVWDLLSFGITGQIFWTLTWTLLRLI